MRLAAVLTSHTAAFVRCYCLAAAFLQPLVAATVSREVARHGGRPAYRAHDADRQAWVWALRPKRCLLAVNRKLRDIVASRLILASPPRVHLTFKVPKRSSGNASSSSMFKNPHNLRSPN